MVAALIARIAYCLFAFFLFATTYAVQMEVEVHGEKAAAYGPIEGIVRIQHREDEHIDPRSFQLQNRFLETEFLRDSLHSTVSLINGVRWEDRFVRSVYRFSLPGVAPGEYVLPPISVVVDGKRMQTESVSYFIHSGMVSDEFRLRAFVRAPTVLYPGQTAELIYRMAYQQPVEASLQQLPFLKAEGFRKLGEPVITHSLQEEISVDEIVQKVQALAPGTYEFPTAVIEGHSYRGDFFGRRLYEKKRLRAEAPPIAVVVAPFPESGRPVEFDGAVGSFTAKARLLGTSEVMVGDRVRLELTIEGRGAWSTVRAPNLARLRAIGREFRLSDLPPQVERNGGRLRIFYEIRPLSVDVCEIPAIPFSSFDPDQHQYVTVQSDPIPLVVSAPVPEQPTNLCDEPIIEEKPLVGEKRGRVMEIRGISLVTAADLDREVPPWKGLWLFPLTGALWGAMWLSRRWLERRKSFDPLLTSHQLFAQARKCWMTNTARAIRDLEAAFLLRLYEKNHVSDVPVTEELPREGIAGQVRRCLEELQSAQYGEKIGVGREHLTQAEALWREL